MAQSNSAKNQGVILTDKTDKLLTIKECSEATGFHTSYFGNLIRDKELEAAKNEKGRWLVKQSTLDAFLANKTVKPRRDPAFVKVEKPGDPPKSLLTQVQEKEKELEVLEAELVNADKIIDELRDTQEAALDALRIELRDMTRKADARGAKIERLEKDIVAFENQIADHNKYLRSTLDNVLQYLMK